MPATSNVASVEVASVEWGSVAAWVAGVGSLVASVVALVVSHRAQETARRGAREARQAASRDRAAGLLVQLVQAVERDRAASEASGSPLRIERSAEGAALCRALWSRRNLFGTVWDVYCEEDQGRIVDLRQRGELYPQMRKELQEALDSLDYEDRAA